MDLVHVSPWTSLFVSTNLDTWATDQPEIFTRDVQINDTAYRRLDPDYYAWLRSRMNLAKLAAGAGRLSQDAFDDLREKFNAVHKWAVAHFGEEALREAVRHLDTRSYAPPVAEPDQPVHLARVAENSAAEAVALVDAIRDRVLALGWSEESLYGCKPATGGSRERRCGLVSLLQASDRIGEVTSQSIEILRASGAQQRFYNLLADQPWIRTLAREQCGHGEEKSLSRPDICATGSEDSP
ncbi:MAG TPA: hypothetical protein PLK67_04995 [Bryobacteraceae bacterium]|nr:hypothetical protein [Bryobacteraceae bacterium]